MKYIRVKVIPRSGKNEIVEIMEDSSGEKTWKIRIKAIPEKGKANKELIRFLSEEFKTEKENISIISGETDHLKLIKIT
ncbi:DUF167 domain-containing protein [Candidatus Peregrinibacteria bacterium]|nr:DUF167 domain-containing protein [Candidatus Peregrinibacteria bacterium]